jgi:hypothetical protein
MVKNKTWENDKYICFYDAVYLFHSLYFNIKTRYIIVNVIIQLGGAHLKKLRRVDGGAKIFEVFRVKNHDFTPKNTIFFHLRREARKLLGYFVWKITILRQKIIFFPNLGGRAPGAPPPPPPKIGKNMKYPKNFRASLRKWKKIVFFGVKSWFFTRNTSKNFAPP